MVSRRIEIPQTYQGLLHAFDAALQLGQSPEGTTLPQAGDFNPCAKQPTAALQLLTENCYLLSPAHRSQAPHNPLQG